MSAFVLFRPILAGANLRDRLIACLGGAIGIALTGWSCWWIGGGPVAPLLVAPIGASAVLVFAVPSSPLAQPWSVIGGNVVSALVGIAIGKMFPVSSATAALAVSGAILAMSCLRCLHPPGGAAALTGVIGGHAVTNLGFLFPFVPVGINSVGLILVGLAFHRLSGHSYPHRAVSAGAHPVPIPKIPFEEADLDLALLDAGEAFDVSRDDLLMLFNLATTHALDRRR